MKSEGVDNDLNILEKNVLEMEIKYEGYIKRENEKIKKRKLIREVCLPEDFNYDEIRGLKIEAKEKLKKLKPLNIETASRISGVDPVDIDLIYLYLKNSNNKS